MKISTIPATRLFQNGLLKYRSLSTILTFFVGMIVFMGGTEHHPAFVAQRMAFMAVITGLLGAGITVWQYNSFLQQVQENYILDKQEGMTNHLKIWLKHFSHLSVMPLITIVMSLIIMVYANGLHGTIWLCGYVMLSPLIAGATRAALLFWLGSPANKRVF